MKNLRSLIFMIVVLTGQINTVPTPASSQTKKVERVKRQLKSQAKYNHPLQILAYHEAGHAVAFAHNYSLNVIEDANIQYNENQGCCVTNTGTYFIKKNNQELENEIMANLAGSISEQVYKSEKMISNQKDILNFLSAYQYSGDMQFVKEDAHSMIMQKSPDLDEKQINTKIDSTIAKLYKQTYKFLTHNKNDVKKIADALLEKQKLSGDEIYNLLDIPKPLMYFEHGPLPEKYKSDYELREFTCYNINKIDTRRTITKNFNGGFTVNREYYFNGDIAKVTQINPDNTKVEISIDPDKKYYKNYYDTNHKIIKTIKYNTDKSIISTINFDANGNEIHEHSNPLPITP
ncbi:MAG: hypothetical protein JO129_00365 [Candidatus Dependentiae bacterium]|nr:hypothetical protein [Candidatus Dependentiae bacterium]